MNQAPSQTNHINIVKPTTKQTRSKLPIRTNVHAGGLVPATVELGKDMLSAGGKFFNEAILWGND